MGWGGKRVGAGRKPGSKNRRKVPLIPARVHRQTVEEMPLDILIGAARDKNLPIELRLAAAAKAAPYYHAKVSGGPPKAAFEMTDLEFKTAIAREKEHQLHAHPGAAPVPGGEWCRRRLSNGGRGWRCSRRSSLAA